MLLKSILATQGMSRPLLSQHFEATAAGTIHMAVYQCIDHEHIVNRLQTLQHDISHLLADGEESKAFLDPQEGMSTRINKAV